MTSSRYGVDELGYKCATKGMTKRCNNEKLTPIKKSSHSSNCFLQLENMKEEWIVIEVSWCFGEYGSGPCTHCLSRSGRCRSLEII